MTETVTTQPAASTPTPVPSTAGDSARTYGADQIREAAAYLGRERAEKFAHVIVERHGGNPKTLATQLTGQAIAASTP